MSTLATVIDTTALLKMLYSSLLAAVSVATVFSLVVLGAARSSDMRRANRTSAATAYAALALLGIVVSLGIVVYGVLLVAHKS